MCWIDEYGYAVGREDWFGKDIGGCTGKRRVKCCSDYVGEDFGNVKEWIWFEKIGKHVHWIEHV